ncbi:hypothetical protein [Bradymonas sediminis]|uniref:Uncharacterized protein n=1 Tax=Bradymonas sediminis TaxID=1548548 RepID=A0A2Z4FK51_9DELT|nr:hypothetical protein [Bradymonas sediminis]AWV89329.1 hypothetical protein DN745_08250 [Bradymonas sediminis]TDP73504.1 hypothetical protein DFR33_106145 [Bradymonas sediminis]
MLQQNYLNHSTAASSYQADRLSIDEILARRQARLDERKNEFPPDFLHGQIQLDEIYRVLGARWVEDAIFVEEFHDEDGELVAWTVASFEDEFLSLEQSMRDEDDDFFERFEELKSDRRHQIVLRVAQNGRAQAGVAKDDRILEMRCTLGRLLELERKHLGVVRDKEVTDVREIYSRREEILQDSRTNILSLVCLCARLAD